MKRRKITNSKLDCCIALLRVFLFLVFFTLAVPAALRAHDCSTDPLNAKD